MGCFFSKEEAPVGKEKTLLDTKQPEKAGTRAGPAEPSNPEAVEAPELLQGQPKEKAAQAAGSAAQQVMEDPGHVVDDVADTAQNVLKDPAEECIERAAALRDEWLSNIAQCSCEDMQVGEVDVVLDTVEKVVTKFLDVFTSKGKQRDADVDIQSLELRKRTKLEQYFAKYSALGQMFIDMSGPAMEAMPFGAPAAAVLGAVYGRAAQAARLSRNCEILLNLLKLVDAQLARVLGRLAKDRKKMHDDVLKALQEVLQQTTKGGRIMKDYVGQGFVLRFILSKGNEIKFYNLDQGIRGAMLKTSFVISMDSLANPADYQPDNSAPLRAAVCAAAGMTEDNLDEKKAQAALRHLRESQPGKLQELFKEHVQQYGSYGDQILAQLLQDVQEDIQQIKGDIVGLRIEFTRLKCFVESQAESSSRQEEHVPLKTYLFAWWKGRIGRRTRSVSVDDFFKRLIDFLKEGEENAIFEYEEEVLKFFPEDMLEVAPKKICLEDGRVLVFFTFVVMPMVDTDKDGVVELDQLLHLQEIGEQCMQKLGESKPPAGMGDLLDYILLGFNKEDFFKRAHYIACTPEVDLVAKKLEVTPMLESMLKNGVRSLLKVHTPDTRQWLFDHVKEWLKTALSAGQDTGTHSQNRMFLLLAGPGMGKTVFSAVMETQLTAQMQTGQKLLLVRHFFKVSEPRAQGKAMVLCLAMQLAEQLPGMAQILLPRAKEHGNANQLTLQDAFNKYLLEPLTELDKEQRSNQPHVVVMLLDALDESTDGEAGYGPVTDLVGHEMAKLPVWVKIVLTGRPQMEKSFQPWKPYLAKIEPQSSENMEDLRIVLKARLEQDGRIVSTEDVPAAVDVLLKKSEGDMIYTKYAFDLLCGKKGRWTIAEMEDEEALPSRLDGMFRAFMGELQDALQEEQPDTLNLLRQQLLPILVAAKSPLSSQQLAVMTGAEQHQVDQLLGLLSNMFPLQERRGTLRVVPYHKSVLDWLTNPTRSKDLFVDAKKGDQILGKACFNAVKAAGASASVPSDGSILQSCAGSQPSGCILEYALHFGVTHFCHVHSRSECLECLEALILDFCGFWPMAFELGFGAELLKNLIALGPKMSTVVKDVVRWLRLTNGYLSTYPRAALQLACDAPHESMVAQKANSLPQKPPGKLLTKEHHWSACLNVIKEGVPNVCSVAVSGETIVSGSPYDKTIRVFDLESGECKKTLTGHTQAAPSVAISSGACVVSGSSDRTLKVWDLESGDCQKTLSGHDDAVNQVVISPDARLCASCSYDGTARVWDLADGACKRVLGHHRKMYFGASLQFLPIIVSCVAIHAEAHLCVSGSEDCNVRIWDLVDGSCKNMFREHGGAVRTVAISSDAHLCVSGSMDKTIRVWNLETGACQKTLSGHTGAVVCVAISPDTRLCASGSLDSTIRVWELESGVCVKTLSGHTAGMSVAFTTDACIVSGSADCTIRVWDLVGETREAPPPGHTDTVLNVQSSPDGSSCMSCSDDGTLRVWDLENGACTKTLSGHGGAVNCFAVDWNAHLCVSGSDDRTLRVWDIRDGKCKKTLSGHPGVVLCVAIHSGANLSVSGSQDSSGRWKTHLKVWDLRDGECKMDLTGVKGPVSCVAISPDARFCVTGHWDETVRVWDLEDGECKKTMTGHTGKVTKVVISSDACLCVTGSSKDETLRVWDLENGESKMELSGPEESPASLAISPDDRFCVSRDKDDTVWKWDLATGEQLACFCRYSEGGEQLMALADCWRAGCHPPALEGGPAGNVVAWPGDDGDTIQWRAAGAGSLSASDPAVFYIMPPMSFDRCFRLFYAKSSRSVLFFDEVTCQFVRYQLLV